MKKIGLIGGLSWVSTAEYYRRLNIGLQLGAGIRRALGPGYLSFNLLFGMGFLDFYKWADKNDRPEGYKAYRDRNLSFQFGYTYPLPE
ncbi:MAG: hypothetical protein L3J31_08920 [Bacteroidales bacterium]|nr:hypothetical protein [Bacteroidales bacterium]